MIPTKMNNRSGPNQRRDFFKVGDFVNFELDEEHVTFRYKGGKDHGGSGEYVNGIVETKCQDYIEVSAVMPDGKLRYFKVPNYSSENYDQNQWWKPGFLKKWKTEHLEINCECGYGNESNLHFLFCPRHPKNNSMGTIEELKDRLAEMKWYTQYEIEEQKLKLSLGS